METAEQRHVYSVSELTALIKSRLEESIGMVWIEGEISGYRLYSSGHAYFSLKDAGGLIKAVLFKYRGDRLRFRPEDGHQVLVLGQVSCYAQRGDLQVVVETMEPRGAGSLQVAFEQLKARLAAEGLFDEDRKRPIPPMPASVGVVTSPDGAAVRDIIKVMRRRSAGTGIIIVPCRVQGDGAAAEIADGIRALNEWGGVEVIIVGRGGGSLEDLWAFNEEEVARAIHASRIPVISAVGHEVDFTIADFVADLRAPTPSAAAELVVRNRVNLARELDGLAARLREAVRSDLEHHRLRLEGLADRRALRDAESFLRAPSQRLDVARTSLERVAGRRLEERRMAVERLAGRLAVFHPRTRLAAFRAAREGLEHRLGRGVAAVIDRVRGTLEGRAGRLDALSPLAVLGRGYGICRRAPDGRVISDASTVTAGDPINIILHRGRIDATVTGATGG